MTVTKAYVATVRTKVTTNCSNLVLPAWQEATGFGSSW
jgi:hypothetical protein